MKRIHSKRTYRKTRIFLYHQTAVDPREHFWTFLGSSLGIGIISFIQQYQHFTQIENVMLIGSFGASAVLVYGAVDSPLAQPRNLIGGHLIGAFVGVTLVKLIVNPDLAWLISALAVAFSIVAMQITKTTHPPGGATALIATMGSEKINSLGYYYLISPVLVGALILFIIALVINNIPKHRFYPIIPYAPKRFFVKYFRKPKV